MKDVDLERYVERIEHEFFRRKGRPGTLSPEDFRRAATWFQDGVPIDVALEAVSSAFEAQDGGRSGGIEEVNSLSFCEPFVDRAIQRRRPNS